MSKHKVKLSGNPKHLICEKCGCQDETVKDTIDPFEYEINGQEIDATLCETCLEDRAMDI